MLIQFKIVPAACQAGAVFRSSAHAELHAANSQNVAGMKTRSDGESMQVNQHRVNLRKRRTKQARAGSRWSGVTSKNHREIGADITAVGIVRSSNRGKYQHEWLDVRLAALRSRE